MSIGASWAASASRSQRSIVLKMRSWCFSILEMLNEDYFFIQIILLWLICQDKPRKASKREISSIVKSGPSIDIMLM